MKNIALIIVFSCVALFATAQSYHPWRILHNGNSFSGPMRIGTNDNQSLVFEANNTFYAKIDSIGRLSLGSYTGVGKLRVVETGTGSERGVYNDAFATGNYPFMQNFRRAGGTEASPTAVTFGEGIGRTSFWGYTGSAYLEGARIEALTNSGTTVLSNRLATEIVFSTMSAATPSVLTEALRIRSGETVTIGTGTTAFGNLNIKSQSSGRNLSMYSNDLVNRWSFTFPNLSNAKDLSLGINGQTYLGFLANGLGDFSFGGNNVWGLATGRHLVLTAPDMAYLSLVDSAYQNGTTHKHIFLQKWDDGVLTFQNALTNIGNVNGYSSVTDLLTIAENGAATFVGDVTIPSEAYDATGWNGNNEVPTKDAVRDKIESLSNSWVGSASSTLDMNQFNIIDVNKITSDSADIDEFMGTTKFNGALNINSNNINNAAQVNTDSCDVLNPSFQNTPTFNYQNYTTTGTLNRELAHYWDGTTDDTLTTSSVLPDESLFFVKNNDASLLLTVLPGSGHTMDDDGRIYPGEGCWFQRHGTVIERITPFRHDYRADLSPTTNASGDFTITHNLGTSNVVYFLTPICDACRYSFRRKTTSGITSNTIVIRVYDETTGLPLASTSLSCSVMVQRIN